MEKPDREWTDFAAERISRGVCSCCSQHPLSDDGKLCVACRVRMTPVVIGEDLKERIVVLESWERVLRSRLLNARQPGLMLDHAKRLREHAAELLSKADAIESELVHDECMSEEIGKELNDCVFKLTVLRYCVSRGIKPKKLRRMFERMMKEGMNKPESTGE